MKAVTALVLLAAIGVVTAQQNGVYRSGAWAGARTPEPTGAERDAQGRVITRNHYENVYQGYTSERLPEDTTYRGKFVPKAPVVESEFDRQQRNLRDAQARYQESERKRIAAEKLAAEQKAKSDAAAFAAAAPQRAAAAAVAAKAERERLRKARGGGPQMCGANARCVAAKFCAQYKGQSVSAEVGADYVSCKGATVCCKGIDWGSALKNKGKSKPNTPTAPNAAGTVAPPRRPPQKGQLRDCQYGGGRCVASNFCTKWGGKVLGAGPKLGCKGQLACCIITKNKLDEALASKKQNKKKF